MSTTLAAKDIFRVDLSKLIRFWVRERPDPKKTPAWVELGHFFAGFDYKLSRLREIDGAKRENAVATCYEATGTFRFAQNAIFDYQNYQALLNGPLAVAMLYGHTWEPDHGTLVLHDWAQNSDGSFSDGRIALVADPDYNAQMAASGTISGFVPFYNRFLVKSVNLPKSGQLSYTVLDSLNNQSAISTVTNSGS